METELAENGTNSRLARERVLADLRTLSGDAEALLHATAHDAGEKVKEARARLTVAIENARRSCGELQDETVAQAKAAATRADVAIRAHPYETIGAAFGIGLLLGFIFGRK